VSPLWLGLAMRDAMVNGWRVGSENSFIAHGVDWKWRTTSAGAR
jgi:hypothetical protein